MAQVSLHENSIYKCSDLALATFLSLVFPIETIDKTNPRKAQFLFKRDNSLDQLLESYWNKQIKVEPRQYFDQLKAIKARLYENP